MTATLTDIGEYIRIDADGTLRLDGAVGKPRDTSFTVQLGKRSRRYEVDPAGIFEISEQLSVAGATGIIDDVEQVLICRRRAMMLYMLGHFAAAEVERAELSTREDKPVIIIPDVRFGSYRLPIAVMRSIYVDTAFTPFVLLDGDGNVVPIPCRLRPPDVDLS